MGSAPNTAATATVAHPATQGLVQSLGVFVDTMIICTMTALIVLVSGLYDGGTNGGIGGAALTQAAVTASFGVAGQWFMTMIVFAFAFSSVLGNYAYADANLTFLGAKPSAFRSFASSRSAGSRSVPLPAGDLWALADVAMGLMALVNLVAIVLLGKWAFAALNDFHRQATDGQDPVFVADEAGLPGPLDGDVWVHGHADKKESHPVT